MADRTAQFHLHSALFGLQGAGAHYYTLNAKEKDHLVTLGWKYEGEGWYGKK
ncbi:hypothetical protein [Allobaculum mucilyticum]|uniref:hypothetical protein n=1 Tax=Allobaculum mucilyticum TaxID=2834459 RepID=UPI001F61F2F5|nr:hypothetical protein [Allobaculum mucilyticum]UNT96407.1 hypothetical protein KWG62_01195 [Allobaculum mucilyticum]